MECISPDSDNPIGSPYQNLSHLNICSRKLGGLVFTRTQSAFTCSKLRTKTLEQGVKYVQS